MQFANAQTTDSASVTSPDTSLINASADTLSSDTIHQEAGDFKSKVEYTSDDSLLFDVEHEVVYLYGNAIVKYEAMVLKANYIEVNLTNKTLFSTFTLDSSKSKIGIPDFAQGEDKFTADEIRYNFNSKKGKIKGVYTQVGEGYIHGETVKKFDDYEYIRNGKYTTCDLPHPHFSFAANKLKLVGNKKIITGPAYFIIEDVPTPIALPFGYFPNRSNRASGIIFPTYGESANLGFFLKNGGYYFGINDYVDLALTGDVYSKGSWGLQGYSRYASRYHFGGNLSVSYSEIKTSEKELPDYNLAKDFFVKWQHTQDAKARPNSLFSANVNAGSSTYYRNNISSESNYLTNTFQSAITYSKTWAGTPYSFSAGMSHNQNTQTHDITISLPQANFSVNRFSPFKRKVLIGTEKWYEKIGVSYQANLQNQIQTVDSLLFSSNSVDKFRNGIQHNIPISTSVKFLKFFTLTPSFNYIEKWYMKTIEKTFDNTVEALVTDTINGFKAAREYSTSASLNTRIYGLVQFKNSKIMAVRHVLSPTVSFTYRPDFSAPSWNYYKTVQLDATGKEGKYSIFESGIFGGPGQGKTGLLAFNLDNNLEMKVKKATDSADATKKIKIFESLSIGTAYNVAADSMRWSNIGINARTTLFEKLNLSLSSSFDPYITDSIGNRFNRSEWKENHRVARHTSTNFSAGFSLNNIAKNHSSSKGSDADLKDINLNPDEYVDLDIPFNLYVSYSLFYTQQGSINSETTQTLNFNGDLSLTPKWKIIFSSGYDFKMKDLSYTSLGFYRDLHCWEMRLTWIPMGFQESFNFQINVKSAILQDLKLVKKNDIYDR
ncbi:MAG: putative LPS assembly protein LptD [Bacteroidia bacterium]